ncbi:MAG TPA: hypothetical protein RMH99_20575 [Sandaracinaceae bacterium LLY-WYZ-13_1]|nr:hypothetical protein [Sandaracinaceae bacterium LLY-WYZ-13_1]
MRRTTTMGLLAMIGLAIGAQRARADDTLELELTVPVALADRATTGNAPAGFGYDAQSGLLTGAEARLLFGESHGYFAFGPTVGAQQMAGPALGLGEGHAFRSTYVDAGIAARGLFPCMSGGDTRWHLSGILALTGVHADAGLGVGGEDNGPAVDARRAASDELDHAGLGWRLALDLSIHEGSFVAGVGLGVRQYFGIDAPVARGWVMDVGVRLGGRIDLIGPPARDPHWE